MKDKRLHPWLKTGLEYGPVTAFLITYLLFRSDTFVIGGTEYSGFVAITAAFIPVFLIATGALWALSGRISRIQVVVAVMLIVFGGLGAWMNDARFFKMKPTAVYLCLALILGTGLALGKSWLKFIMEDMIPLKEKGWMILTTRVTVLFLASAAANELVWRTQSERFWVLFETLAMPIVIAGFFLTQLPLFVDYATWGAPKKKKNRPKTRAR